MEDKSNYDESSNKKVLKIQPRANVQDKPNTLEIRPKEKACCCGGNDKCSPEPITQFNKNDTWITGEIETPIGIVPQVSTRLTSKDMFGAWKVRWGINRMNYKINPGIYAVGNPDTTSPVLVTANYKLTFDTLRKELEGLDTWILVLDTKGINVWCAAGKGTFGTKELISRIKKIKLSQIVVHRNLILPQLGAPGVTAHEVAKHTGFKVIYGPVRAEDIKKFINSGLKADEEMRTVKFSLYNRLVLTPVEIVGTFKTSLIVFGILFLANIIGLGPFGWVDFYAFVGALLAGCVLTPVLLPWIPGKAFAWKGWLLGFIWTVSVNLLNGYPNAPEYSILKALGLFLILPSVSAFYAMNFTGSSTYTSFSGVIKEMKIAVPAIVLSISAGILLILANSFVKL
ncbi:MAG: mercury methylation corrinoid protein HgcA [Bacillota bacterium]|nr:mercury methylation corrinoid protein HgcA [Bacillota bacterium]